jgi:hypothetical protein
MTKSATIWTIVIIIVVVVAFWAWFAYQPSVPGYGTNPVTPTSTMGNMPGMTPPVFDKSVSDGTVTVQYPSADFALATNGQQILLNAVIPACDSDFEYCLYFNNSSTFAGTNFESAGLRIEKRPDLKTQAHCLGVEPSGYTTLTPTIATSTGYAISLFGNVGSGAAGNLATDNIYRLAYNGICYEFDARIAQTDFGNYPSGTIQQFTSTDQVNLQSEIQSILNTVTLPSGQHVSFIQA